MGLGKCQVSMAAMPKASTTIGSPGARGIPRARQTCTKMASTKASQGTESKSHAKGKHSILHHRQSRWQGHLQSKTDLHQDGKHQGSQGPESKRPCKRQTSVNFTFHHHGHQRPETCPSKASLQEEGKHQGHPPFNASWIWLS